MKSLLTLCLVFLLLTTSLALATETRVLSMGGVNDIVRDDANISLYPQTVAQYGGLFTVESSSDNMFNMGANWTMGESVLGAYFSRLNYEIYHELYNDQDTMDHKLSLIYGRPLGDIPFGFSFNYFGTSFESDFDFEESQNLWSLSRWEFQAGASFLEEKLDLSAGYGKTDWTDEGTGSGTEAGTLTAPDGASTLVFNARYWLEPRGKWQMVPHAAYAKDKEKMEYYYDGSVSSTDEIKVNAYRLGLGTNYQASERVMTVTDFGIMAEKVTRTQVLMFTDPNEENEAIEKTQYLPFFKVGLDAEVRDWLDLRCGVHTAWSKDTYQANPDGGDSNERIEKTGETMMYLGFGAHWGSLIIDGYMNDASFLHNGPYFISGNSTSGGLAGRLSLTYQFD
jgi:hypothetical protein